MQTSAITKRDLASSVIAVPPLARNEDLSLNRDENATLVRHLEHGGVTTLLYGGNANLYHLRPSEYQPLLAMLEEIAARGTLVIPSIGPAFGTMMDQVEILRDHAFPCVMILPQVGFTTPGGVETGIRRVAEALGAPVVLYMKHEGYLELEGVRRLCDDGLVSWVKYAIVRDNPAEDPVLEKLVELVDPKRVVSGIGEQPAIVHMRRFGVAGFTSGCVCVNPGLSCRMLEALAAGNDIRAEEIQALFRPLEDLRNAIHPVRVLHQAVSAAGIARTGPILPLLDPLTTSENVHVSAAARSLAAIS